VRRNQRLELYWKWLTGRGGQQQQGDALARRCSVGGYAPPPVLNHIRGIFDK